MERGGPGPKRGETRGAAHDLTIHSTVLTTDKQPRVSAPKVNCVWAEELLPRAPAISYTSNPNPWSSMDPPPPRVNRCFCFIPVDASPNPLEDPVSSLGPVSSLMRNCSLLAVVWPLSRVWLLRPHGQRSLTGYSAWDSLGKNTGVGCHFHLQGIFPIQESNLGLLHCRQILYQLSYKGRL